MPASKTKLLPAAQAGAYGTFRVSKKAKRAKFSPKRQEQVHAVRRKRACLRCSLLRIACSHHDICLPCEQLAVVLHAHEKQKLSFSGCIRTMPSEASIWEALLTSHESQDVPVALRQKLDMTTISLGFSNSVMWDLDRLVDDIVNWLDNPTLSKTSKVGILSSPQFLDLIKSSVDEDIATNFHCMIYAISLAYTQPTSPDKHYLNIPELLQIGSMAGHKFLKSLDKQLKPQRLKDCSQDELRSLFLLVIGTILAVGYTDLSASSKDSHDSAQFKEMQSFLCQILAHYVIFLGSQLKHRIACGPDQFILQAAPARWHKQGQFEWKTALDMSEPSPDLDLERGSDFGSSIDLSHFLETANSLSPIITDSSYCSAGKVLQNSLCTPGENILSQGNVFQDPMYRDVYPSQHFDATTYGQPVQAHDPGDPWEYSIKDSTNPIFDPFAFVNHDNTSSQQHLRDEVAGGLMSTTGLPISFSAYEPEPNSLWDASRSDKQFNAWQQRDCNERSPHFEVPNGHTISISTHSSHPDEKHETHAECSLEGILKHRRTNRSKLNFEQRLEISRARRRSTCSRCSIGNVTCMRRGLTDIPTLCQKCSTKSEDFLIYEKRILSFVPTRTLTPEGSVFPFDKNYGLFGLRTAADIEERRLLV